MLWMFSVEWVVGRGSRGVGVMGSRGTYRYLFLMFSLSVPMRTDNITAANEFFFTNINPEQMVKFQMLDIPNNVTFAVLQLHAWKHKVIVIM